MADKGDANAIRQSGGDDTERQQVAAQAESNLHACAYDRTAPTDATKGVEQNVTPEQHLTAAEQGITNVLNALTQKDGNGQTILDRAKAAGEMDTFKGLTEMVKACQQTFALNDNRDGKGVSDLLQRLDKTMKN